MEAGTKILIGAGLTALLAWGSHSAMNGGEKFVSGLEAKANEALSSNAIAGVTAAAERAPQLRRVIILSGDKTDAEKADIIAKMKAIPGVADARWDTGPVVATATAEPAKIEAPASKEAIAACQQDINQVMAGKTINFQSGSAYLAENNAVLDEVAAALKPCAGMAVEVQGHTDLSGAPATNQTLSQERAERVVAALVAKGVPAERMAAKGYGSSQPLENIRSAAANAKNRRTVFALAAAAAAAPEGGN
ncbi:MAG: OmpA family protein [Sphingorhabdus sp.]